MTKITSQQQLDQLIKNSFEDILEVFVLFDGGYRSSKNISFNDSSSYYVYNETYDDEDIIKFKDFNKSVIGEAMSEGRLYMY